MRVTTERTTCPICKSPDAIERYISTTDYSDIVCPQCKRVVWTSELTGSAERGEFFLCRLYLPDGTVKEYVPEDVPVTPEEQARASAEPGPFLFWRDE